MLRTDGDDPDAARPIESQRDDLIEQTYNQAR